MKRNLWYFFFSCLGLFYPLIISAHNSFYSEQDTAKSEKSLTWVNLGIGGLAPGFDGFLDFGGYGQIAGSIDLSFQKNKHIISVKSIFYSSEILGNNKLTSIELRYGLIHKRPLWNCSLSSGINNTWFTKSIYIYPYQLETTRYNRIGIPLDLQLFLTGKRIGIGIDGFLVFGKDFTTYGALLCLQLGKLR